MVDGEVVALTPEEEAAMIAEWDANSVETAEKNRIAGIKQEADTRIALRIPGATPPSDKVKVLEREMNLMMLNAELDDIVIKGGVLTAEQQADKDSFIVLKDLIKDIRDMSNLAEINGDSVDVFKLALDAKGY